MMDPRNDVKVSSFNLPNALTVLRILLVPVFIWVYLMGTPAARWGALAIFIVASVTDHLDGHLARKWNLITDFGRLADPLADKALTLSAFFLLSYSLGNVWFWIFTILVTIREIGITVLREVLRKKGTVVAASTGGKLKTVLQITLIILLLIPWDTFVPNQGILTAVWVVAAILAVVTLAVTMISGWQYVWAAWKESRR